MDFIATLNRRDGINYDNLQQQLASALDIRNNGTFLAGSDLKLSEETDPSQVASVFKFEGRYELPATD